MGWWSGFFGIGGDGGSSGNHRAYPAAARSGSRVRPELPYTRVHPYLLLQDLDTLRARSKWLTRANGYAQAAARDLPSLIVGSTGIMPGIDESLWMQWADDPDAVSTRTAGCRWSGCSGPSRGRWW